VKETLRQVPDGGVGYGALVATGAVAPWPGGDFSFNYLGRAGLGDGGDHPLVRLAGDDPGPAASPLQRRPFPFDLNAVVRQGRLELYWSYPEGRVRRATAESLGLDHVEFREGLLEEMPVEDGWADVVISNGVFNLCADKEAIFSEMLRVLRPGGVLQFADIAHARPVPESAMREIELWTG